MPYVFVPFANRGKSRLTLVVLLLALALSIAPWAGAEEAAPQPDVTSVPAQETPAETVPVETEVPVVPVETEPVATEPVVAEPVETEPVVTETTVPVPTETQPASTEPVGTEPSIPDSGDATAAPNPDTPATAEPTTAPTEVPNPVVTWSQPEPVKCELRDGNTAGLKYQDSDRYFCKAAVSVDSDISMPADMKIEWKLDVSFPDSYSLEFPVGSLAGIKTQLPGETPAATIYTVTHPWTAETSVQTLDFEIVVARNTCAVGEQLLTLRATPAISTETSAAEIVQQGIAPENAKVYSPIIDAEAPTVAFDGAVEFESLSATSAGIENTITTGSATIVVTGEWDPCQTWTINLSGAVDVPAETPALLRVVSINNEIHTGEACDLQTACDVIVLPETGDAATPQRYTIGLELQLHENTPVGSFGISLQSELNSVGAQP